MIDLTLEQLGFESPIAINLHDLTPTHLDECREGMGHCDYADPCIIGSLMSFGERHCLSDHIGRLSYRRDDPNSPVVTHYPVEDDIASLVAAGLVTIAADQLNDAVAIQTAFDNRQWEDVLEIASRYMSHST